MLPDGSTVTWVGGYKLGFFGEFGPDSAPSLLFRPISDLLFDAQGRLLVLDKEPGALRQIDLSTCPSTAGPVIRSVLESAGSEEAMTLVAGQLVSIYGLRLGPKQGVGAVLDAEGKIPVELAGTRVWFNGYPGRVLYSSEYQVNAIVPFALDSPRGFGYMSSGTASSLTASAPMSTIKAPLPSDVPRPRSWVARLRC